jgi:hypothetical protein
MFHSLRNQRIIAASFFIIGNAIILTIQFACDSPINSAIDRGDWSVPIVYATWALFSMVCYFTTMFSYPCFVDVESPRLSWIELKLGSEREGKFQQSQELLMDVDHDCPEVVNASDRKDELMAITRHQRFCVECCLVKPYYTKHCYICNHCIALFDHHCPFMGTCIGGSNHGQFWSFCVVEAVAVVWSIFLMQDTTVKNGTPNSVVLLKDISTLVLYFLAFVSVALSCMHFYLGVIGKKTYQLLKWGEIEHPPILTDSPDGTIASRSGAFLYCYNFAAFISGRVPDWARVSPQCFTFGELGVSTPDIGLV